LTRLRRDGNTFGVQRARRHQRLLAGLALGLLALIAELVGRSLTHRLDFGRHVAAPSYSGAEYYPVLLAVVKVGIALMLARLAWRFVKARRSLPSDARWKPRVRVELSPRLWLLSFVTTSVFYLVQMDAEGISSGRWPLLAPWLHTSALPVFAVLSVIVALVYRAVERWLSDYETYAQETAARVSRGAASLPVPRETRVALESPRLLFGLAFESRPPPAPA
jgi:membrane protein implicated in regulation of membrane protease activity